MPKTKTKPTAKKATESTILNVALVWDMSGSMGIVRESAVEGAGDYISKLATDEVAENIRFSLVAFDTVFERWYTDAKLSEVDTGKISAQYMPRGMTALNDAVADAIAQMDERLTGDRSDERVLIVVLTDGQENSSREYGGPGGTSRLAALVKAKEETGRWTFVYLGAGSPEAVINTAARYNIPAGNTRAYAGGTASGQSASFASMSVGTVASAVPGAAGATTDWFSDAGLKSAEEQESEEDV